MKPLWTQEQAIAFESAQETISDLMGIYTARISAEKKSAAPDSELLKNLRAERSRLAHERLGLRVSDQAEIKRIRSEYGATIRAWRTPGQSAAA